MSTGIYDEKSGTLFSVDAFGAILSREEKDVATYQEKELEQDMTMWETFDCPWVHSVDEQKYGKSLEQVRMMNPSMILSAHLPMARNKTDQLLKVARALPSTPPFIAPNQEAFAHMVSAITSSHAKG